MHHCRGGKGLFACDASSKLKGAREIANEHYEVLYLGHTINRQSQRRPLILLAKNKMYLLNHGSPCRSIELLAGPRYTCQSPLRSARHPRRRFRSLRFAPAYMFVAILVISVLGTMCYLAFNLSFSYQFVSYHPKKGTTRYYPRIFALRPVDLRVPTESRVFDSTEFVDNIEREAIVEQRVKGLLNNNGVDPETSSCQPMLPWQTAHHSTCNQFHEIGMTSNDLVRLGEGGWRDAWAYDRELFNGHVYNRKEHVILKTLWGRMERGFDELSYELHRIDAVSMERLLSSPRIVDIYGFCGQSTLTEAAGYTLEDLMKRNGDAVPFKQRLKYAVNIAQAVADIHDVDGEGNTTIVHRDLKADNIVFVNGQIKVNDFNSAVLLMWNAKRQQPCKFQKNWKVPWFDGGLEYPFTEKVDVFCLGGLLFYVLTGHDPSIENTGKMRLPFSRNSRTDSIVRKYIDIMERCFKIKRKKRPTAKAVAAELQELLAMDDS